MGNSLRIPGVVEIYLNEDNSLYMKVFKENAFGDIRFSPSNEGFTSKVFHFLDSNGIPISKENRAKIKNFLKNLKLRDIIFVKESGYDSLSIAKGESEETILEFYNDMENLVIGFSFNREELKEFITKLKGFVGNDFQYWLYYHGNLEWRFKKNEIPTIDQVHEVLINQGFYGCEVRSKEIKFSEEILKRDIILKKALLNEIL